MVVFTQAVTHAALARGEKDRVSTAVQELGGYSEIARLLTEQGSRSVSRQAVYSWYKRRDTTGFPEAAAVTENGMKFDKEQVIAWYAGYKSPAFARWGKRNVSNALHIRHALRAQAPR